MEHGGWGLLLEPIVLGLLLAPSLAGLFLSIAATGAFLARHPFKLAIRDWRHHRRSARTALATRFAFLYLIIAALGLALAVKTYSADLLLPIIVAAPFGLLQFAYDSFGRSRLLLPELAGSISIAAVSSAIAISGGWPRSLAFGLWLILAARNLPTILYVRARLRLLHHKSAATRMVLVTHVLAILIGLTLARVGLVPFLGVAALVILLLRAFLGLYKPRNQVTPKKLGLCEFAFGAMMVLAVLLGHLTGW